MLYSMMRKILFGFEPETSHMLALNALDLLHKTGLLKSRSYHNPVTVMGITFPNPLGLAAGLDKNADHLPALSKLGFGFIEVGTVTPRPQPGNPKPRLFRIPEAKAIVNRLGFNNKGIDYLIEKVKASNYQGILGINIGKNADTPLEKAVDDYLIGLSKAYPYAHYITINISSPNTQGLRDLQQVNYLRSLLSSLKHRQQALAEQYQKRVPLVIKLSPDLSNEEITEIAACIVDLGIEAVAATNTTLTRAGVENLKNASETGGLSGAPLTQKSTQVIQQIAKQLDSRIPIIGLGGIMTAEDAKQKMQAGASLIQVYTGFIYKGPPLIADIALNWK